MALPVDFDTRTGFVEVGGTQFPVCETPYMLGESETIETITAWKMSRDEMFHYAKNGGTVFLCILNGQPPCHVIGATAVPFEGQNVVYTHPDCYDLPVQKKYVTHNGQKNFMVISAWQLSKQQQKVTFENNGVIFLSIVGALPFLQINAIKPF